MQELAYVYILASGFKRLYIGVTSEIEIRVAKHKNKSHPGSFTARYNIDQLVYFERFGDIRDAIARETQIKKWSRVKKIGLIVASNPEWRDLSLDWGNVMEPWDGSLREPKTFGDSGSSLRDLREGKYRGFSTPQDDETVLLRSK